MTGRRAELILGPATDRSGPPEELAKRLVLQATPGYLVRRLDSRATTLFEAHTGQSALTPRQFGLLKVVHESGTVKQSELAARLDLDRSTLGEMLARMVDRGLVVRHAVPEDRRTSEVELTPLGTATLLAVIDGAVEAQVAFLEPLPGYLRPVFMKCLEILVNGADPADD